MHVSQRLACCQSRQLGDETFSRLGFFARSLRFLGAWMDLN